MLLIIIWNFTYISALDGFEHFPKACVNDSNIASHYGVTKEECSSLCLENDKCLAFEYWVDYGGSNKKISGYCAQQDSSDKSGCDGVEYNYDLYIKKGNWSFDLQKIWSLNIKNHIANKFTMDCLLLMIQFFRI